MKLLFCFYLGFFFLAFSVQAASSSMLDRKLTMPATMYPSDSIVKTIPKSGLKAQTPGVISFLSGITAVILVFAGAAVGAIVFGILAIITGLAGRSGARKLTKNKQKSSPGSPEVKSAGAKFGIVVGILTIVAALIISFFNAISSWGG